MSDAKKRVLLEEQRREEKKFDFEKDFAMYYTFVADMLSYALAKYDRILYFLDRRGDMQCKVRRFQPLIGDAVLQYHRGHEQELMEEVCENLMPVDGGYVDREAIDDCVCDVAENIFKGENFAKEFFVFCSFLVELAYYCVDNDHVEQLSMIVDSTAAVYELFLKRRFAVFGGWHALYRYAALYLTYRKELEVNVVIEATEQF